MNEKAQGKIFVTGNTVIDALHMVVDKLKCDETLAKEQDDVLAAAGYDVTRLALVYLSGNFMMVKDVMPNSSNMKRMKAVISSR